MRRGAPREGYKAWLPPPFLAIVLPHTTGPSNPSRCLGEIYLRSKQAAPWERDERRVLRSASFGPIQLWTCKEILILAFSSFWCFSHLCGCVYSWSSPHRKCQTKGLGAFIKWKWWRPSERIIWLGWVFPPGIQPYHCVCKTFTIQNLCSSVLQHQTYFP